MTLQRACALLHFDPALVERLHRGERLPWLDAEDHRLLLAVDRRAWGTDPHLRGRALTALVEEFPVSVAIRGIAGLDRFFSDARFHRCVMEGGSLALAFGAWVGGDVARLEGAVAEARRAISPVGRRGARVVAAELGAGTLGAWTGLRAGLGADEVLAGRRAPAPSIFPGKEWLLVEDRPEGATVGEVPEALGRLVHGAASVHDRADLERLAAELGADEPGVLIDELAAEGLVVAD